MKTDIDNERWDHILSHVGVNCFTNSICSLLPFKIILYCGAFPGSFLFKTPFQHFLRPVSVFGTEPTCCCLLDSRCDAIVLAAPLTLTAVSLTETARPGDVLTTRQSIATASSLQKQCREPTNSRAHRISHTAGSSERARYKQVSARRCEC